MIHKLVACVGEVFGEGLAAAFALGAIIALWSLL